MPVGDTVALSASGKLISFNRTTPGTLVGSADVSGLTAGESLLGIDYRPADAKLYALGSAGNVYTVEPSTGVATLKAALKAAPGDDDPFAALSGNDFAVDFNPVADRLRVVSNLGQNLRINVDTGDAITDGLISLTGAAATVTAAGYSNAFFGTTATQLFDIDAASGLLHLQDPPNNGTLAAGLALGVNAEAVNGFDVDARNNTGYAALRVGGTQTLYRVNIASGAATAVGAIAGGEAIRGLALQQPAAPTVLGLTADNQLLAFDPKAPNTITATTPITGLGAGETVIGIDTRPKDGLLYALTSAAKLYTVNTSHRRGHAEGDAHRRCRRHHGAVHRARGHGVQRRLQSRGRPLARDRRQRPEPAHQRRHRCHLHRRHDQPHRHARRCCWHRPTPTASTAPPRRCCSTSTPRATCSRCRRRRTTARWPTSAPWASTSRGMAGFDIAGGANGLALAALRSGASGPFTLYSVSLTTGAATLYRNTSGNAALNQIGGANGPALLDIAIRF